MPTEKFKFEIYEDLVEHIVENVFGRMREIADRRLIRNFRLELGRFSYTSKPSDAFKIDHAPGCGGVDAWEWQLKFIVGFNMGTLNKYVYIKGIALRGTVTDDNATGGYDFRILEEDIGSTHKGKK